MYLLTYLFIGYMAQSSLQAVATLVATTVAATIAPCILALGVCLVRVNK